MGVKFLALFVLSHRIVHSPVLFGHFYRHFLQNDQTYRCSAASCGSANTEIPLNAQVSSFQNRPTHRRQTFPVSRRTIKGKGNNFPCCPVAEFRLYACRLMCSEWPERLWAGLFVARLVQVSSNDWLWTACLLMWMGLLWATPFQLGPMKSPVWWSLSAQGLSSQQKGLLFVRTINWWWIIPNPLYSSGQSNGHGCMQTYNMLSHVCTQLQAHQILH